MKKKYSMSPPKNCSKLQFMQKKYQPVEKNNLLFKQGRKERKGA